MLMIQSRFDVKFWVYLILNAIGNALITMFLIGQGISSGTYFVIAYLLWQVTNIVISIITVTKGYPDHALQLYLKICMFAQGILCLLVLVLACVVCYMCNNEYCVILYISALAGAVVDLMIGLGGLLMMLDACKKNEAELVKTDDSN